MEFSGRLSAFPIGDILQWAHNDQRTGSLVVRRSGRVPTAITILGSLLSIKPVIELTDGQVDEVVAAVRKAVREACALALARLAAGPTGIPGEKAS